MGGVHWLHLSDLHIGPVGIGASWSDIRAEVARDLSDLHDAAGPFDAIFLTGDLVESGAAAEYEELTRTLDWIYAILEKLGSPSPALFAVPGNHDLDRTAYDTPAGRALLHWSADPDLRSRLFWDAERGKEYRDVVWAAFARYTEWYTSFLADHPFSTLGAPAASGSNASPDATPVRTKGRSPVASNVTHGILPGEFSATLQNDDLSIGVVGLCSAFLHFHDRMGMGKLALHPEQLHHACGGDAGTWLAGHHTSMLLTHHPPTWLTPDALAYYQGAIFVPQWFAAHFCGHMHEGLAPPTPAQTANLMNSRIPGPHALRLIQGPSLFGRETYYDTDGAARPRTQGLSAGRIERISGTRARLTVWPRIAQRAGAAGWRIIPDYLSYALDSAARNGLSWEVDVRAPAPLTPLPPAPPAGQAQASSTPIPGSLRPPPSLRSSVPAAAAAPAPGQPAPPAPSPPVFVPEPPGLPYHPEWYIPQPQREETASQLLRIAGAPVVVMAPPMSGKSTFLRRLVVRMREEEAAVGMTHAGLVLEVDLAKLSDETLDDPSECLLAIGSLLHEATARAWRDTRRSASDLPAWSPPKDSLEAPDRLVTDFFEKHVLARIQGRAAVVVDRFDRLIGRKACNDVSRMLRQWIQDSTATPVWSCLRVVFAVTSAALLFSEASETSDLFNVQVHVRLEPFGRDDISSLAKRYRTDWTTEEIDTLFRITGGQPYLTRLLLFLAATGVPKPDLLDVELLKMEHAALVLQQLWMRIKSREELRRPLCLLLKNQDAKGREYVPTMEEATLLVTAGLVRRETVKGERRSTYRVPSELIASFIRDRC